MIILIILIILSLFLFLFLSFKVFRRDEENNKKDKEKTNKEKTNKEKTSKKTKEIVSEPKKTNNELIAKAISLGIPTPEIHSPSRLKQLIMLAEMKPKKPDISLEEKTTLEKVPIINNFFKKIKEPKIKEPKIKETKIKEPKIKEPKIKEPKIKVPTTEEQQIPIQKFLPQYVNQTPLNFDPEKDYFKQKLNDYKIKNQFLKQENKFIYFLKNQEISFMNKMDRDKDNIILHNKLNSNNIENKSNGENFNFRLIQQQIELIKNYLYYQKDNKINKNTPINFTNKIIKEQFLKNKINQALINQNIAKKNILNQKQIEANKIQQNIAKNNFLNQKQIESNKIQQNIAKNNFLNQKQIEANKIQQNIAKNNILNQKQILTDPIDQIIYKNNILKQQQIEANKIHQNIAKNNILKQQQIEANKIQQNIAKNNILKQKQIEANQINQNIKNNTLAFQNFNKKQQSSLTKMIKNLENQLINERQNFQKKDADKIMEKIFKEVKKLGDKKLETMLNENLESNDLISERDNLISERDNLISEIKLETMLNENLERENLIGTIEAEIREINKLSN